MTWQDDRNQRGIFDIYLNRSLDRGATWLTSDIRLDTDLSGAPGSLSPQIEASGDSVYVTWVEGREDIFTGTAGDIYFNRSLDGGTTWLPSEIRLDTGRQQEAVERR